LHCRAVSKCCVMQMAVNNAEIHLWKQIHMYITLEVMQRYATSSIFAHISDMCKTDFNGESATPLYPVRRRGNRTHQSGWLVVRARWWLIMVMGAIKWGTRGTRPPTFPDSGDIICHVPQIFLLRFPNILVSHQAVSLTFYNKIAHIIIVLARY